MNWLDWSKLPDVIAVGLLTWAFASVSRSVHTITSRSWLFGWYCIILHFGIQLIEPALPWIATPLDAWTILSLMLAAMLFIRASAPYERLATVTYILTLMSVLYAATLCALMFNAPNWVIGLAEAAMCLAPLALTLIHPEWNNRVLRWTMSVLHLGLWAALWLLMPNPDHVSLSINAMLFVLYAACAAHFLYSYREGTPGAFIGVAGFLFWASVFVIAPLQEIYFPKVTIESEVWNLPKYVVAVGMILLVLEEQLAKNRHLALHDELTGLPNRRLFHDRLAMALERAQRTNTQAALLVVDLDDFKIVNDTYGHHIGDLLLQKIAALFKSRMQQPDTVARTGGDEFAVILEPPVSRAHATQVGRSLLELLKGTFELNEHTIRTKASVGIAIYPDDALDLKSLCIRADMRMYENKLGDAMLEES
jgi:diguanylate cyclase (GGDEF)-like protein